METELPAEEVPYQERVLAHLRASLTLPAAFASQEEEAPNARRYGIQVEPVQDVPPSLLRTMLLLHAAALEGMDPGMVVDAPAQAWSATSDDEQQDRQRQVELLVHLLDSMIAAKGKQYHTLQ